MILMNSPNCSLQAVYSITLLVSSLLPDIYIKHHTGISRGVRLLNVLAAALRSSLGRWEVPPTNNIWLVILLGSNLSAFWLETVFYLPVGENVVSIALLTMATVAGNPSWCSNPALKDLLPNFQSAASTIHHVLHMDRFRDVLIKVKYLI